MAAIGTIRNKFGWLLIGLMILSLIAFIIMGSESGGGSNRAQISDELAIVDGNAISNTKFDEMVTANLNNYKQQTQSSSVPEQTVAAIRNSTYNQMITESLYKRKYDENGIVVSDDEFADMITGTRIHPGIANSFKDASGNFDLDAFNNYLANLDVENNPTDEQGTKRKQWKAFEEGIASERLSKKYKTLVEKSLTVPSAMAKDKYFNDKTIVSFDYVKVAYSSINDSTISLTDQDLKDYMTAHYKQFEQEASVDIKIASFPIKPSQNDRVEAENWMTKKIAEWKESKEDSLFVSLHSELPYDVAYYGKDELVSSFSDSLFTAPIATVFGYEKKGDELIATKLLDRKLVPDSLKARHLLISFDEVKTQEEAIAKRALFDSLYSLIDSAGYQLKDLTAQYSDDKSNAGNGGDLNVVKPGERAKPFNDLIFFGMKEGEVKTVATQFGLHIVEVYSAKPTKRAVQIATLKKTVLASTKTQEKAYADASIFSGSNNTKEKFLEAGENTFLVDGAFITKETTKIPKVEGSPREIIKWAFKSEEGQVSKPFSIGESYYVALLLTKNEKGLPKITDNNKLFVQTPAIKEKKATMLKEKMQGSDLTTMASANNVTVESATSLSFNNTSISGVPEPKVIGKALATAENTVSSPIEGEDGVYVLKVTSKVSAEDTPDAYANYIQSIQNQFKISLPSKLDEAIRKAANVEDNRFDFF